MHRSGPLPLTFQGLEQGFGGKNCQNNQSQGKPRVHQFNRNKLHFVHNQITSHVMPKCAS